MFLNSKSHENPLSYRDLNSQTGIRLRHWILDTEDQNKNFHRK
jgi:hypothetical protein